MNMPLTWIEISTSAIHHNISAYKSIVGPNVHLAPVIKGNAYGHGILQVGSIVQEHPDVSYICVVNLSEALLLRKQGITKPLLVLSYLDAPLEQALLHTIDLGVFDLETAQTLSTLASQLGVTAKVHLKIDTGLSRLGQRYTDAASFVLAVAQLPSCSIQGIFTHLANSEHKDQHYVRYQLKNFDAVINALEKENITVPFKHTSCTAALLSTKETHYNFARLGIGTYGLWPSSDNKTLAALTAPHFTLKPALSWKTKIIQIKTIPEGSTIGYDRTFISNRETKVALLPIGYYEGYDRKLSNRGVVLIHDRPARVVGRISMNLTIIDITDHPNAKVGDTVLLLGGTGTTSAETLSEVIGTINYEVVTRINPLIERIVTP